ncbi:hypothetical protein HD806DRAFT_514385 [Xylariaceae sp. AK1471]|nr:hypothetical protein HD806DRAFT_514385 [Xylariaceae sp. AK1471]
MASQIPRLTRCLSHLRPSSSTLIRPAQSLQSTIRHASSFQSGPSPPRLPPDQQAEFERLQRTANTQEGFNATSSPDFSSLSKSDKSSSSQSNSTPSDPAVAATQTPEVDGETPTPTPTPLRKGAPPEFQGDVNPRTGEVGGPKNEPLRWGARGDYSFNGRVTDF